MKITTIGLDIAKSIFHLFAVNRIRSRYAGIAEFTKNTQKSCQVFSFQLKTTYNSYLSPPHLDAEGQDS